MKENDERMLEYAKALKWYCKGVDGDCKGCLFDTDNKCVLSSFPEDWDLDDLIKKQSVELLKEMRDNMSGSNGDKAKNKITALTMAIEALEG